MKTAILAGGLGTRLRPAVGDRPKPMAIVEGKPFIEYLINFLKGQYVREIILCVCYMADKIIEYFRDGSTFGVNIEYSVENDPLGTAGALKNAESLLSEERFYVLNGDTYLEINLGSLLRYHVDNEALATIVLAKAPDSKRYGSVEMDEDGRILRFVEKQKRRSGGYINAGLYVFEPRLLDHIPEGRESSLELEVFPDLLENGAPLYGYPTSGHFVDIGTPRDYIKFQRKIRRMVKPDH